MSTAPVTHRERGVKTDPQRIRDSATLGKGGVKYTHTQVTLSLMVTPCTG